MWMGYNPPFFKLKKKGVMETTIGLVKATLAIRGGGEERKKEEGCGKRNLGCHEAPLGKTICMWYGVAPSTY